MKIGMLVAAVFLFLSGCAIGGAPEPRTSAVIDWVDFLKLNGHSYMGTFQSVINDPSAVTDQVAGVVKYKVADVVTNPGYKIKDGDAAFLAVGTKLYLVKGYDADKLLAAADETLIGGYRLYRGDEAAKAMPDEYKDMPKDDVERIALYREQETQPYKTLTAAEKDDFIRLLEDGEDAQGYNPQTKNGDPAYYKMVFDVGQPIGYAYTIADDGAHVYFYPWDTRLVDAAIRKWIYR